MSSSSLTSPDSGSELSELSDIETAELEKKVLAKSKGSLDAWLQGNDGASSPPPPKRKREPSPPHDYVLADNPNIAFLVMFRARFAAAFPRFVPHFGPQDIENSVVGTVPGETTEKLLCAILGLVLNRKKDIGLGHYTRALEDAILSNKHQWPKSWDKNPISGEASFNNMTPEQRLDLLKTLSLWALNSSDAIQAIIKDSYKQNRHDDDLNQPLSVQAWGRDGDKRRYWLVEGQDDTHFRLYRESNPALKTNTWWSVAGSIEEVKAYSEKLRAEGSQAAKRLSERIESAVERFELGEDKRKRREYRLARKAQFSRPEPGFSLYEGRTRGKRIRYTFSDDEDGTSDAYSGRRSTRNATPAEPAGPTVTASGRQVRSRLGGTYGESLLSGQGQPASDSAVDTEGLDAVDTTRTRSGRLSSGRQRPAVDSDEESNAASSGNEWRGDDEEDDADDETDGDVDMDDDDDGDLGNDADQGSPKSLVVTLKVSSNQQKPQMQPQTQPPSSVGTATPVQNQLNIMQISTPDSEPSSSQNHGHDHEAGGAAASTNGSTVMPASKPMPLGMSKKDADPESPCVSSITPKSLNADGGNGAKYLEEEEEKTKTEPVEPPAAGVAG